MIAARFRPLDILMAALVALLAWSCMAGAQDRLPDESQRTISETERAIPSTRGNYDGLLRLRNQIEAIRDRLHARLIQMAPRREELRKEAEKLGPKPPSEEPAALAAQRTRHDEAQKTFGERLKQLEVLAQRANQLWDRLTDLRKSLFSARLLMHVSSIFDPSFWQEVVRVELPLFGERSRLAVNQWVVHLDEHRSIEAAVALCAGTLALLALFVVIHAVLRRRRRALVDEQRMPGEVAVMQHALFVFAMRAVPLPLAALLFDVLVRRLDLAPPAIEDFLLSVAVALGVMGLARGTLGSLLSPHAPRWRVVRCTDRTARIVSRLTIATADIYAVGIVLSAWNKLIGARVETLVAMIMVLTATMAARTAWSLKRLVPDPEESADTPSIEAPCYGFVTFRAGWARPLLWLAVTVCASCLVFGYVALAGFVSGRVAISAGAIALALLLVTAVNRILDHSFEAGSRLNRSVARGIGLNGGTVEVAATFLSGVMRFLIIVTTGLIVFMPWGLEYGDVNPFADLATFVTAADLRGWLGTFGFAVLTFVVGLLGTRLIVGWIDGSLLPRTRLDQSLRHSLRTVFGYAGFVLTALLTLSMIGVNAQNVAVVAGALSVGIGFGLQSIVSNFVSGLIVLAERQVRVGDVVNVKSEEGIVQRISVRSTLIGTYEKSSLIVPNTELISGVVRNRTLTDLTQQLRITLLLDHDSDPRKVREIALRVAGAHANVLTQPAPTLLFMKVSELGLEFELRCLVDDVGGLLRVRSELHYTLHDAFRGARIRFARTTPPNEALEPQLALASG